MRGLSLEGLSIILPWFSLGSSYRGALALEGDVLLFVFVPQLLGERGTQRHTEEVAWEKGHRFWPELF